jgi:hypothetical protein
MIFISPLLTIEVTAISKKNPRNPNHINGNIFLLKNVMLDDIFFITLHGANIVSRSHFGVINYAKVVYIPTEYPPRFL